MARTRRFLNIAAGTAAGAGTIGPKTFPNATTWLTSCVPIRGATGVVFHITGTDVNNPIQTTAINFGNTADGSFMLASGNSAISVTVLGTAGGNRLDKGGFYVLGVPAGVQKYFHIDFAQFSVLSNAITQHTGVQIDAEVFFDGDATDMIGSVGQFLTVPTP